MFNFGISEIAVIVILAVVVLGPKRLPDAFRYLGKLLRDFRRTGNEIRETFEVALSDESSPIEKAPADNVTMTLLHSSDATKSESGNGA